MGISKDENLIRIISFFNLKGSKLSPETGIREKFSKADWFNPIESHLRIRYHAIENRMIETFDYVTPDNINRKTHSYTYASILRDIGSVFDSTIRQIIIKSGVEGYQDNIYGFIKFLEKYVPELKIMAIDLVTNLKSIIPFQKGEKGIPNWWHAYNDVKHDEPNKYQQGNLENALTGLAALKLVHYVICRSIESRVFVNPGIPVPPEHMKRRYLLFPDE